MRRLLGFLGPDRLAVALIVGLLFVSSLTSLYLPNLMAQIVDQGVVKGDVPYMLHVGALMLAVALLGVAASVAGGYFSARVMAAFGKRLRRRFFAHVQRFMPHEFARIGTSSLIVRSTNDIMQVQQFVGSLLRMMVRAPLMMVGGVAMAVYTDARLSLVLVVVMPVLAAVIGLTLRRGVALFDQVQRKVDALNRTVRENLSGVRVIRAFDRMEHERSRLEEANRGVTAASLEVFTLMALLSPVMMLVVNASTIAVVWLGGHLIAAGTMQVGSLMAFIQYATQILYSIIMVSMMFFRLPQAQVSARRIYEVLDVTPELHDPDVPKTPQSEEGGVVFDHVCFSYPDAGQPALERVSFTVRKGEMTAIVGGTGAGKTTLVNLVPRFFDVRSGRVLVDGVDVREMAQEALRKKIGFVPQKPVVFSGTAAENIRFGAPSATDEAVRQAARSAQADAFIGAMGGYDARIERGGANLSGGQKQRLTIARALVRKADIYIFDDSFSALDYKTSAALRAALRREAKGACILLVAQRVSAAMHADRIVVLDGGRVAGVGTHRQLLQTCSVYQEIVASQLSADEIA